jgi:hypothetical protein
MLRHLIIAVAARQQPNPFGLTYFTCHKQTIAEIEKPFQIVRIHRGSAFEMAPCGIEIAGLHETPADIEAMFRDIRLGLGEALIEFGRFPKAGLPVEAKGLIYQSIA